MENPILQNKKTGNPELSRIQLEDMEWALRQRDCGYRDFLWQHPHLQVYHGEMMWNNCENVQSSFVNTTFLLDLLQNQMGCGKENRTIREWRDIIQKKKGEERPTANKVPTIVAEKMQPRPVATTKDTKTQTAKMQRPATKKRQSSSVKRIQPQPAMTTHHDDLAQTVKT